MKIQHKILILLIVFIFGLISTAFYVKYNRPTGGNQIMQCSANKLIPYQKEVFINGEKITDELTVIKYEGKTYFSIDKLQIYISKRFISSENNTVTIRRDNVKPSFLLMSKEAVYIDLEKLLQYVHINNNVYKSTGNMFIDSMLPSSVNINGVTYYLTDEKIENFDVDQEQIDEVLVDGRGAWKDDSSYLIEDDWGNVYKFEKSKIGL